MQHQGKFNSFLQRVVAAAVTAEQVGGFERIGDIWAMTAPGGAANAVGPGVGWFLATENDGRFTRAPGYRQKSAFLVICDHGSAC